MAVPLFSVGPVKDPYKGSLECLWQRVFDTVTRNPTARHAQAARSAAADCNGLRPTRRGILSFTEGLEWNVFLGLCLDVESLNPSEQTYVFWKKMRPN